MSFLKIFEWNKPSRAVTRRVEVDQAVLTFSDQSMIPLSPRPSLGVQQLLDHKYRQAIDSLSAHVADTQLKLSFMEQAGLATNAYRRGVDQLTAEYIQGKVAAHRAERDEILACLSQPQIVLESTWTMMGLKAVD